MTNEEIRSFLAVVRTGTLSDAAEHLYVTHPTLTQRITSLEKSLGYKLIERHPGVRKVKITSRGEALIPIAEQWLNLSEAARAIGNETPMDHFSIAAIESISTFIMAPICTKLINQYPNLRLKIKLQYSANTYDDMHHHLVDLGIINNTQYSKDLLCRPSFQEDMFFVCKTGAGYSPVVHPRDLNGCNSIFVPWFNDFEVWYHYWFHDDPCRIYLQNINLLKICMDQGDGWTIVPASVANWLDSFPEFELHTIENGPGFRTNYFLTGKGEDSPYILSVFDLLKNELAHHRGFRILF